MNKGVVTIVSYRNDSRSILHKGKVWSRNMYIDNTFYSQHISGNDISNLIVNLKKQNSVYMSDITEYASEDGIINVKNVYGVDNTFCCFIKDTKGIIKLMSIPSKLPVEYATLGHDSKNACIVPVVIARDGDNYRAINIS